MQVHVSGDLPELRQHFVNVSKQLRNAHISPNGARAVFEARGEIITVPAEKGDARNLTNTPGGDGTRSGLVARRQDASPTSPTNPASTRCMCARRTAMGEVKKIELGTSPASTSMPRWSPGQQEDRLSWTATSPLVHRSGARKPVKVDRTIYLDGRR